MKWHKSYLGIVSEDGRYEIQRSSNKGSKGWSVAGEVSTYHLIDRTKRGAEATVGHFPTRQAAKDAIS